MPRRISASVVHPEVGRQSRGAQLLPTVAASAILTTKWTEWRLRNGVEKKVSQTIPDLLDLHYNVYIYIYIIHIYIYTLNIFIHTLNTYIEYIHWIYIYWYMYNICIYIYTHRCIIISITKWFDDFLHRSASGSHGMWRRQQARSR